MRKILLPYQWLATSLLLACLPVLAAAALDWRLALLAHGRLALFLIASLLLALHLITRRWRLALATAGAVAWIGWLPMAYLLPSADNTATSPVRMVTVNLHGASADLNTLSARLANTDPDFVVLTERQSISDQQLRALRPDYHWQMSPFDDVFDLAIASRWPIRRIHIARPLFYAPVLSLDICPPGRECVRLIALHPPPPLDDDNDRLSAVQFALAEFFARATTGPLVIAGDLNQTPWSPRLRQILQSAHLQDAGRLRGWQTSWGNRCPLLGLPLDHVLLGGGARPVHMQRGPEIGSDHWPVLVDFTV